MKIKNLLLIVFVLSVSCLMGQNHNNENNKKSCEFCSTGESTLTPEEAKIFRDNYKPAIIQSNLLQPDNWVYGNNQKQVFDSKGTEFWLTMMRNYDMVSPTLYLDITSSENTNGVVTIPGIGFTESFSVTANSITRVTLPNASMVGSDGMEYKGIHVTANDEVTVYGINRIEHTTDAFLGLPVDILSTQYLAMTYTGAAGLKHSPEFAIVSPYNNNVIQITPASNTSGGWSAGSTYDVVLNEGEVYQVIGNDDLTGSLVQSSLPVAFFSGNSCANIPVGFGYCDHIVEQIPPYSTWGTTFITYPLAGRMHGDTWRFLAAQDNTTLNINGTNVATLDFGDFFETILETSSFVTSSNPILAAQFSNGNTWDPELADNGDPFMMIVPPYQQFMADYTFATPTNGFTLNYTNLTVETLGIPFQYLDNVLVDPLDFSVISTSDFSGGSLSLSLGTHAASNLNSFQFGNYVYGFDADDSYGYPGGLSLDFINPGGAPVITLTNPTINLINNSQPAEVGLTISATITDPEEPFVQSASLFYRGVGGAIYTAVSMTEGADNVWSGDIPGLIMQFPGVEFYISATDGQLTTTNPGTDPNNNPHAIAVANDPPLITHSPVIFGEVGVDIPISCEVEDVTEFVDVVELKYRKNGGNPVYTTMLLLNTVGDIYEGTISGAEMTSLGLDYYIKAIDNFGVSSSSGTENNPYFIDTPILDPIISVDPLSLSESLFPDETSTQTFTISNSGDADLIFDLEDIETSKRLSIKSVKKTINDGDRSDDFLNYLNAQLKNRSKSARDISWLSEDPLLGTIVPGGSLDIEVGFDATGLNPDIYNAQILINCNDPVTPQVVVPVTLEVLSMGCSYLTTNDNENNALEGVPDYDLDDFLCNDDPIVPIEFNIFVDQTEITSAQLSIYAWDVDETGSAPVGGYPEVDEVYFNGHLIGTLTGADEEWSTSVFSIDPSFVNPGPDGKNLVNILVSTLGQYWCVNIDWGQLNINDCGEEAYIRSVNLDQAQYVQGADVEITVEVDTDIPTQDVIVETNLLDENMVNVAGISNTITIHLVENEPLSVTLPLPNNATLGATYHAQVIVYDAGSYVQQDLKLTPFMIWDGNGFMLCMQPGWQLISSWVEPADPQLDLLMAELNVNNSLTFMLGTMGIYWPSQSVNTLGDWNSHYAYKVKMAEQGCIIFTGDEVVDKTVELNTGINFMPMLSGMNVPAIDVFSQITDELLYAFDIQDQLVYWPQGGIYTLNTLVPGRGYLVNMIEEGTLTFPETTKSAGVNHPIVIMDAPWIVNNTGMQHIISIASDALSELEPGDIIGVFNNDGVCTGMAQYQKAGENLALIAWGDDNTTGEIDGMVSDEQLNLRVYSKLTGDENILIPVWNTNLNPSNRFAENGLSMVTGFKAATSLDENMLEMISIYPNPNSGLFVVSGINTMVEIQVMNSTGQLIKSLATDQSLEIDLSNYAGGIYYLKVLSQGNIKVEKLIVK